MKTVEFGVKCSNFHLMRAFKEECEAMGYKYRDDFTEFTTGNVRNFGAMYFTDKWRGESFGFSLTILGIDHPTFTLPQNYDAAIEHARNSINDTKKLQLNSQYSAEIKFSKEVVKVGCQEFSFSKITELANLINKK